MQRPGPTRMLSRALPAPWRSALVSPSWTARRTVSLWASDQEACARRSTGSPGSRTLRSSPAARAAPIARSRSARSATGAVEASAAPPRRTRTSSRTSSRLAPAVRSTAARAGRRTSESPTARAVEACTLIAVRLWPSRSCSSRASSRRSRATAASRCRSARRARSSASRRRWRASVATIRTAAAEAPVATAHTIMSTAPPGTGARYPGADAARPRASILIGLRTAPARAAPRAARLQRPSGLHRTTACRLVRAVRLRGDRPRTTGEEYVSSAYRARTTAVTTKEARSARRRSSWADAMRTCRMRSAT